MKLKLSIIAFASAAFLSLATQTTASTLSLIESGESLNADLDGGSFAPNITIIPVPAVNIGGQEEWVITLNNGYTFAPGLFVPGQPIFLGEPAGETGVNLIGIPSATLDDVAPDALPVNSVMWASDVVFLGNTVGVADALPNTLSIPEGVRDPSGAPIDLFLADIAVPDSGSTLALAGVAFVAVSALRSRIKR